MPFAAAIRTGDSQCSDSQSRSQCHHQVQWLGCPESEPAFIRCRPIARSLLLEPCWSPGPNPGARWSRVVVACSTIRLPFLLFPSNVYPVPGPRRSLFFPLPLFSTHLGRHRQFRLSPTSPSFPVSPPAFILLLFYLTTVVHFGSIINSVHSIRSRHSFRVTYLLSRSESSIIIIIIINTTTTTTPSSASPLSHTYHTLSATHPGNPNTARHLVLTTTILLSLLILLCPPTAA